MEPSARAERDTRANARALSVVDLDEARALYGSLYTSVSLERTSRKLGFSWRSHIIQLGGVSIASSSYVSGLRGETGSVDDIYSFSIPLVAAAGRAVIGREDLAFGSGESGFVVSPKMPAKIRLADNFRGMQLTVRRAALEDAFLSLYGASAQGALQLSPRVAVGDAEGAHLRMLRFLVREMELDSPILTSAPLLARYVDALLHAVLAEQPHDQPVARHPARHAGPAHLRRAEEFIAAHADQHISLSTLAETTGVSGRALQAAFRKRHGCSPMQFMRSQRLLLARQRLLARPPGATVTEIALACGFVHLGRFSVQYRAVFGEAPSQTLRRG